MKKFTIILILSLSSCCPLRKVCREAMVMNADSIQSNIKTVTVWRDTVITVLLKGDTLYKTEPLYLERGLYNSEVSRLSSPLAVSYAWVKEGVLNHKLLQPDTSLHRQVKDALRNTVTTRDTKHSVVKTKILHDPTRWQWFQIYLGRGLLFLGVIWLLYLAVQRSWFKVHS